MKPNKTLDCRGLYCPVPVLKVRQALDTMQDGEILEVLADDPAAEEDVSQLVARTGHELMRKEKVGDAFKLVIKKRGRRSNEL